LNARSLPIVLADPDQVQQQYRERLESLLELSSDWYWEQDEHYRFTLIVGTSANKRQRNHIRSRHHALGSRRGSRG
jgi:hypothetical protein